MSIYCRDEIFNLAILAWIRVKWPCALLMQRLKELGRDFNEVGLGVESAIKGRVTRARDMVNRVAQLVE